MNDAYSEYGGSIKPQRRHRQHTRTRRVWPEASITTALGVERGMDSQREHDRIYRAALQSMADGLILSIYLQKRHECRVFTDDEGHCRFNSVAPPNDKTPAPADRVVSPPIDQCRHLVAVCDG